jgi:prolyl-tRNA editing enzyme YbaK/EbsC (Cys-tRNA(Pro) deacylase)
MSIEKVREYLKQYGMEERVLEFEASSATVDLAAEALHVDGARICKTLSFRNKEEGAIVVQMAGDAKVDNHKYKQTFGVKAKFLTPDEVLEFTGHPIGGVCAFGIDREDVKIYCDESLQRFDTVFPACGTGNSAIELTCDELFRVSRAISWVDVTKLPEE